jgi:hypothetical protein
VFLDQHNGVRLIEHMVSVQKGLCSLGAAYFVRDLRWVRVFLQARPGFAVNLAWRDYSVKI